MVGPGYQDNKIKLNKYFSGSQSQILFIFPLDTPVGPVSTEGTAGEPGGVTETEKDLTAAHTRQ